MELHIRERLLIPGFLPKQNSFTNFNLKKSILNKISISDKDKAEYKIVENKETECIEWNIKKDKELPLIVEFTAEEKAYLVKACEELAEKSLPDDTWMVVDYIYNEANTK